MAESSVVLVKKKKKKKKRFGELIDSKTLTLTTFLSLQRIQYWVKSNRLLFTCLTTTNRALRKGLNDFGV